MAANCVHSLSLLVDERDTHAVEPLLQLLPDYSHPQQTNVVIALGRIGDLRAAGPLLDVRARTQRKETTGATYRAFMKMNSPETNALLVRALNDADSARRKAASTVLGGLRDIPKGPELVPDLLEALMDENSTVFKTARRILFQVVDGRSRNLLRDALEPAQGSTRRAIEEALQKTEEEPREPSAASEPSP